MEARGAHNPEDTRSNRVAGIVKLDAINAATFYRLSSGAERQAHNLEVVGSKPTGGITQFGSFFHFTEVERLHTDTIILSHFHGGRFIVRHLLY